MRKPAVIYGFLFLVLTQVYVCPLRAQQNPLEAYILALHEKVENENRLTGQFNPAQAHSLPLGIVKEVGSSRYIVCIDSAWFTPQGAFFNAYMALEFPGASRKLAFAAKNVMFNPQGVMPGPQTRLMLASEHTLALGPNIHMMFKPDGSNYIEWDCNGFNAVNLKGFFEFNPAILQPDPVLAPNTDKVTASFEIYTQDVHNIIVQTNVSPFIVKGIKDIGFTVTGATVDLSETTDVAAMVFPPGYQNPSNNLPGSFTGFYLRNLTVRLPQELNNNNQPATLQAQNMIIDQTGLSGTFVGTNVVNIQSGSMSGWAFSVNEIGVTLANNHISGGQIKGKVKLPVSENNEFAYQGQVMQNNQTQQVDYSIMVSPANNIQANVLSANLTLFSTSFIRVEKSNSKLIPFAKLNGELAFNHNNVQTGKLTFQDLQFGTTRPYLYSGTFGLGNGNNNAGNFPVSIEQVYLLISQNNPGIGVKVKVNFMEQADNGFSATTTVAVYAKIEEQGVAATGENGDSYKTKWTFDKIKIHDVILKSNTTLYGLDGMISFKDNDLIYGKGFFGSLGLTLKKPSEFAGKTMAFSAWFGKINGYRYFYVDGNFPVKIPMGNISIYQLYGGLFYHMKNSKTPEQMMAGTGTANPAQFYVPDNSIGIGFKAGTTLAHTLSNKAFNADAVLELLFNSAQNGGGLNSVSFMGNVFFMTTIEERKGKPVEQNKMYGGFMLTYDFNNNIFHAIANTAINYSPVTAFGQCVVHYEPQNWYVNFGKPSQRVNIGISGLASLSAYVMLGQMLEPMPPVPANVAQIVGTYGMSNNRNETELAEAKGIAMGATLHMGFGGSFGWEDKFEVYFSIGAGAGFDVMVANYGPNAHCSGGGEKAGINGWYATGQIYAYLSGHVGVRGHVKFLPGCNNFCMVDKDFNFIVLSLSAAAVLQARLPKPYYVAGAVGVTYDILGVLSGNFNFDFKLGNYCQVVN